VIQNQISILHGRQWKDPVIKASVTLASNCLDKNRQSIDGREFPYLTKLGEKKTLIRSPFFQKKKKTLTT
jgi:hypothetical protein